MDDYDDDWDEQCDREEDEWEEAVQECGLRPPHLGGGCTLGGTEHCDFECPFRDHPEWLTGETDDDSKESQDGEATETGRMEGV